MRLIDAEKLKERLIDGYSSVPQTIKKEHPLMNRAHIELIDAIDSIPEVDALDKMRDEIKAEMDDIASGCIAKYSYDEGYYSGLRWVLRKIDKYKAQTE